jgi:adenosylhomocysteine nucleosidase
MSAIDHPCILFALGREATPFRRLCRLQKVPGPVPVHLGVSGSLSVVIVETGVGHGRMHKALDWLLKKPTLDNHLYQPRLVLSGGYSGALQAHLQVGDLVSASEVVSTDGRSWPAPRAAPAHVAAHRGRLLTVSGTVTDPGEKRELGRKHDALAVDMETAVVAEECSRHGVPFACLRAISDDVHTPLSPHLDRLIVNGRVSAWRLMTQTLRRPGIVVELWRLARNTRLAAHRLAGGLLEVLKSEP